MKLLQLCLAILLLTSCGNPPTVPPADKEIPHGPQLIPEPTATPVGTVKLKKIKNLDIDFTRTVYLNNAVDKYTVNKAIFEIKTLDDTMGTIWLLIDSPGGSVFDGERLVSTIESATNPVNTVCTNMCASMGAIIHQYGAKRYAYDRASLMFHDASGGLEGPVLHMETMLKFIKRKIEKSNRYIANRSSMSYDDFMLLQIKDLWIDSEDAKNIGLLDDIIAVKINSNDTPVAPNNDPMEKQKEVEPKSPVVVPKPPKIILEN